MWAGSPQGGTDTRPPALHIPALGTSALPHLEPRTSNPTPGTHPRTQAIWYPSTWHRTPQHLGHCTPWGQHPTSQHPAAVPTHQPPQQLASHTQHRSALASLHSSTQHQQAATPAGLSGRWVQEEQLGWGEDLPWVCPSWEKPRRLSCSADTETPTRWKKLTVCCPQAWRPQNEPLEPGG